MKNKIVFIYLLTIFHQSQTANALEIDSNVSITQKESFELATLNYQSCVYESINGKSDGDCESNTSDPACIGAYSALQLSMQCNQYYPPPNQNTCEIYTYSLAERQAFIADASKHLTNGTQCSSGDNSSQSSVLAMQSQETIVGGIVELQSAAEKNASGISGAAAVNLKNSPNGENTNGKYAASFDSEGNYIGNDGSDLLGLEKGDLYKRIHAGESFSDIFANTPVANKMSMIEKSKLIASLDNPDDFARKSNLEKSPIAIAIAAPLPAKATETAKAKETAPIDTVVVKLATRSLASFATNESSSLFDRIRYQIQYQQQKSTKKEHPYFATADESLFDRIKKRIRKRSAPLLAKIIL